MVIFEYLQTRLFLNDYIKHLPKNGRGEITKMASHLRASPTLISHVLSGEKILTLEQAQSLIKYLGLIGLEEEYFLFLIQYERSGTADLKKFWKNKLIDLKNKSLKLSNRLKSEKILSEQQRAIFYSSPIYMALRLFTSVGEKGKTVYEVADRFGLSTIKCAELLKFLVENNLCLEQNGYYRMGEQSVMLEKSSAHLIRYQTDWRIKSIQAGEELSEKELMFTCPVSLSKKDFEKLREEIVQFIQNFLETIHQSPAEEIACLNIDWFWIRK